MLPDLARLNPDAVAFALEQSGWAIEHADLDVTRGTVDLRFKRFDGRMLDLRVDHLGRSTVERWHRRVSLGPSKAYRGGPQGDVIDDQFLGRERHATPRHALLSLCGYVAENPSPGFRALASADLLLLLGVTP